MSDEPPIPGGPWTFGKIIVAIIIFAAIIGIMYVALGVFGVAIPTWAIHILWIVVVAVVAIIAVKFLLKFF